MATDTDNDMEDLETRKRKLDAAIRRRRRANAYCHPAATNLAMEKITEKFFTEANYGSRSEAGKKDGR